MTPAPPRPAAAAPRERTGLRRAWPAAVTAAVAVAAGLLPGLAGAVVPAAVTSVALAAAVAVLLRRAGAGEHPAAWRWYAGALAGGWLGSVSAPLLTGSLTASIMGSVPGQLLMVAAVWRLRPPGAWAAGASRTLIALALFVAATTLSLHAVVHLAGRPDRVSPLVAAGGQVVLATCAVSTAAALLLLSVTPAAGRRVARLVLAGQTASAVATTVSVLMLTIPPGPLDLVVHPATVTAVTAFAAAARRDRRDGRPATAPDRSGSGLATALLPHVMALVGGSLLIALAMVGHLDAVDVVLAVAGLGLLVAHQAVSWRDTDRITRELERSSARSRALVQASTDPVMIVDDQLRITFASPAVRDLLGYPPEQVVGRRLGQSLHPDDAPTTLSTLGPSAGVDKVRTARIRHADGTWRLIQTTVRDLRHDPDVGALVLYCRDVTRSPAEGTPDAEPRGLSTLDPDTGLPNRAALAHRLATLARAARTARGGVPDSALVVIGIAGLDGADVADLEARAPGTRAAVLQETTARLARGLRGEDWLARGNGGDFAAVVEGTIEEAKVVAARLVADVQPVTTPAGTVRLTAAAGVVTLLPEVDAGEAMRHADLALRTARAEGPGRVRCYDDALRMVQDRRARLREDLATALRRGELRLVFQPIVDLALHRTSSVEALLRWRHPEFGEVSPAEFVPLAEESAFIGELSRWVLIEACRTVAATGEDGPAVAVNLSARHVRGGELVHDVVTALERTGLPAARLVLEITESLLLDEPHVVEDLQTLRSLGCRVAVDDFGTGWSSLAYLVDLPIDVLKMDRQFLAGFDSDPQRRALCRAVLQLGASLDMAVVVEGVETAVELGLLRDMGHRYLQGFLLSRPLERPALLAGGWAAAAEVAAGPGGDAGTPVVVPSPRTVPVA